MTIDANIIIVYLAGERIIIETLSQWREAGQLLFLSTMAEAEVLSFPAWTPEERKDTEDFLEDGFTSLAFDRNIARIAAAIRRQRTVKLPDAAIAATVIAMHVPLVTRNERDFRNVSGLTVVTI
jgi:predicted nucleic acid-binding protein